MAVRAFSACHPAPVTRHPVHVDQLHAVYPGVYRYIQGVYRGVHRGVKKRRFEQWRGKETFRAVLRKVASIGAVVRVLLRSIIKRSVAEGRRNFSSPDAAPLRYALLNTSQKLLKKYLF